jgi:2-iminobutanoate/2-iminopropanoate deaminase
VYCSGQVGTDPATGELVEGTVADRTVSRQARCRR